MDSKNKRVLQRVSTLSLKVVRELRGVPGRDGGFVATRKLAYIKEA